MCSLRRWSDSQCSRASRRTRRSRSSTKLSLSYVATVQFDRVLRYFAGGGVSLEKQYHALFGKVAHRCAWLSQLTSKRVARDFYQNIGTIATESMVQVQLGRRKLGQVEESRKGCGRAMCSCSMAERSGSWKPGCSPRKSRRRTVPSPTVPRWYANKMPLASGLAAEVVRLRTEVANAWWESVRLIRRRKWRSSACSRRSAVARESHDQRGALPSWCSRSQENADKAECPALAAIRISPLCLQRARAG